MGAFRRNPDNRAPGSGYGMRDRRQGTKRSSMLAVTVGIVACGLVVATILSYLLGIVTFGLLPGTLTPRTPTTETTWLEPIKVALTTAAGIGGAVALVVAYRKQRLAERREYHEVAADRRAQSAVDREIEQSYRERYVVAVQQLGSSDSTARLAGIYALSNLADAWVDERQQCVDVVCAYLRLPWTPEAAYPRAAMRVDQGQPTSAPVRTGEGEVRRTALRVVGEHLLPETVRPPGRESWSELSLDLCGAVLPDLDWSGCQLMGKITFSGVVFRGMVNFSNATFGSRTPFDSATFQGEALFGTANFEADVTFERASFHGRARFGGTTFARHAEFGYARFTEGVWFGYAEFMSSAGFGHASFDGAARFGKAVFHRGSWFAHATFAGDRPFSGATFHGRSEFEGASFRGDSGLGDVAPG